MGLRTRIMPKLDSVAMFPYFTMPVAHMRAWQLYVGQTTWVIFLGLLFWLISALIEATPLNRSPALKKGVSTLKDLATGEGVQSDYAVM
jgi:hypothetical protein